MSGGHEEFHQLMERCLAGDPDAIRVLLDSYQEDLKRVIHHRFHRRLRNLYDPEDFLQSVWGEFFAIPTDKLKFASSSALRAFLVDLATTKMIDTFRSRLQTQRRNLNRERSLDGSAKPEALGVAAGDTTPSQSAIEDEAWAELIKGLPETSQTILEMLREGRTHLEISQHVRVSERTIRRLLDRLQPRRKS